MLLSYFNKRLDDIIKMIEFNTSGMIKFTLNCKMHECLGFAGVIERYRIFTAKKNNVMMQQSFSIVLYLV